MTVEGLPHMNVIERWLRGEVVNNTVGITTYGGPFHGRTRIVELDEQGRPPARQRARGSRKSPPTDAWHVYCCDREGSPGWLACNGWM